MCSNLFVLLFLVTSCLVVTAQSCMEWIPIKKKLKGLLLIKLTRSLVWSHYILWIKSHFDNISEIFSFMDHKNFNQIGWEVLDFDSDLDSSNVSGFDFIRQVVQKNHEPEFSYISVVLFNKLNFVRRNLVFQGSAKSHQWSLYCWSIFFFIFA